MTEDEAKTKWCPMVRYQGGQPLNRDACYDLKGTHCIGSDCMMWRDLFDDQPYASDATRRVRGYCGLAGKP